MTIFTTNCTLSARICLSNGTAPPPPGIDQADDFGSSQFNGLIPGIIAVLLVLPPLVTLCCCIICLRRSRRRRFLGSKFNQENFMSLSDAEGQAFPVVPSVLGATHEPNQEPAHTDEAFEDRESESLSSTGVEREQLLPVHDRAATFFPWMEAEAEKEDAGFRILNWIRGSRSYLRGLPTYHRHDSHESLSNEKSSEILGVHNEKLVPLDSAALETPRRHLALTQAAFTEQIDMWDLDRTVTSTSGSGSDLESSSMSSGLDCPLETHKRRAVDTIMAECRPWLSHGPFLGVKIAAGGRESGSGGGSGPSMVSPASLRSSRSSASISSSSITYAANTNCNGNGKRLSQDGGYSEKSTKKSRQTTSSACDIVKVRLACPFFQRNPKRHLKHRSCAGPGWPSIHRLKEHLYRSHSLPIHCHRCGGVFPQETTLISHLRQARPCDLQPLNLPEGITKDQEAVLRKKKQSVDSDETRWKEMYSVLFPDEDGDLVPSPYYEYESRDEVADYDRFHRREFLRLVRAKLEESVEGMAGSLEDQLRTELFSILRSAQSEVFSSYRSGSQSAALPGQKVLTPSSLVSHRQQQEAPRGLSAESVSPATPPLAEASPDDSLENRGGNDGLLLFDQLDESYLSAQINPRHLELSTSDLDSDLSMFLQGHSNSEIFSSIPNQGEVTGDIAFSHENRDQRRTQNTTNLQSALDGQSNFVFEDWHF